LIMEIGEERSVILSSHILSEIQATCHEVKMIEAGKIVFTGTMDDFNNYIQPDSFVAIMANPPSLEELQKIPGINRVEVLSENLFRFRFIGSHHITETIIELSVSRNWHLEEIQLEKSSLDEVFARLSEMAISN
jgi:ABC-2 type transport system ATP-binding protein